MSLPWTGHDRRPHGFRSDANPAPTRERGCVAAYRPGRGFGFISPEHNCGDVYVQAQDVEDADVDLVPGETVEYEPQVGLAGQLVAVSVRRVAPWG